MANLYDISRPLEPGMAAWPGDAAYHIEWTARRARGDAYNAAALHMSSHAGTHADAPSHLFDDGASIDHCSLHAYLGPALVVEIPLSEPAQDQASGGNLISALTLAEIDLRHVERLLIKTGVEPPAFGFDGRYRSLAPDIVDLFVQREVGLVGVDAPSIDAWTSSELEMHHRLLSHGIAILEGLDLSQAPPGWYELIALPLKCVGADSSPVRAVLRELPS